MSLHVHSIIYIFAEGRLQLRDYFSRTYPKLSKKIISYPLIRNCTCANQEVRNVRKPYVRKADGVMDSCGEVMHHPIIACFNG